MHNRAWKDRVTCREAAERANLPVHLVSNWVSQGRVKSRTRAGRIWLVDPAEVAAMAAAYRARRAAPAKPLPAKTARAGTEPKRACEEHDRCLMVERSRELLPPHDRAELERRRAKFLALRGDAA